MSWLDAPLSDFCIDVKSGGTPSSHVESYYGGEIPWLRTQEVMFKKILDTEIKITDEGLSNSAAKWIPENSVIVAMYGNTAGRSAVNKIPLTTNQACCNLIINDETCDYRYVFYALYQRYEELKGLSKGAAQNNLNAAQVKSFNIPKPPKIIQVKIGDILSSYDDLIENNLRRIQLLEESARLLYREWFLYLRFPGHEQVKIIDGVPDGWGRKQLNQVATLNYGKALKAEMRLPGPFPVYGSSGEVGSHEKALVKGPGIVVGRKGNVGSVYWVNNDFYPIDTVYFISAEESSLFLYHALQNVQFINTDVAVPGLNRDMAYSREILVPDDKNYQRFLSEVNPIHEHVNKLQDYNKKLAQARDLLLPKIMSCELTV